MVVTRTRIPLKSFEKQLSEMPLEYLICMDIGHKWDPATLEVEYGDFKLGLRCSRCDMERDRWRGPDGKMRNRYWHPRSDFGFRHTGRRTMDQRSEIRYTWQSEMEPNLPDSSKEHADGD